MFSVSSSLLRYWESEFSKLRPQKNRKGDRRYTKKDIAEIEKIYTLVKERGFTLEGAKKEMKKKRLPNPNTEITRRLTSLKQKLQKLQGRL